MRSGIESCMTPLRLAFALRFKPMGKERPRVTKFGTFMPKAYEAWRAMVRWQVRSQVPADLAGLLPLTDRLRFSATFSAVHGAMGPDLDNAIGALWDAIQVPPKGGWGLIANDRQIRRVDAEVVAGPSGIRFALEVMP